MKALVTGFAIACTLTACKRKQPAAPRPDSAAQMDVTHRAQKGGGATSGDERGSNAQIIDAGSRVEDEVELADADAAGPRGYAVAGKALWLVTPPKSDKVAAGRERLADRDLQ